MTFDAKVMIYHAKMQILNYITSYFYNKFITITKSCQKPNKIRGYVHNQDTNHQKPPKNHKVRGLYS
jgi:hypothetical protein